MPKKGPTADDYRNVNPANELAVALGLAESGGDTIKRIVEDGKTHVITLGDLSNNVKDAAKAGKPIKNE